jgi:hypothetical protein
LKELNKDVITTSTANSSGRRMSRRLSRKNTLQSKNNVEKVEATLVEWKKIYRDYQGPGMPNFVSEKEFSETGLLSSYFKKF